MRQISHPYFKRCVTYKNTKSTQLSQAFNKFISLVYRQYMYVFQVSTFLVSWLFRRTVLNTLPDIFLNSLSLERNRTLRSIWGKLNPLYPRILCGKLGWNGQCSTWKGVKIVKSLQMVDTRQILISKVNLTLWLRWANKNMLQSYYRNHLSSQMGSQTEPNTDTHGESC